MELIDTNKSFLENIYFLSGPVLAVLGLFIFRQIKLAKNQLIIAKQQLIESQNQIKITSQREAANIAADKVRDYCTEIIPFENRIFDEKVKINYIEFKGPIRNFTNDEVKDWDKDFLDWFLKKPIEITELELNVLNKLEAFSIYFIKGIADEKIAFSSIGKAFCESVKRLYPTMTIFRGSKNPNKDYEILIQLYRLWSERLESYKTEFEKEELTKEVQTKIEQLEHLNSRKFNSENISIIGVEK